MAVRETLLPGLAFDELEMHDVDALGARPRHRRALRPGQVPASHVAWLGQTYSSPPLPPELDGAVVGQLARRDQDFLLRGFDVGEPHGALGFQVVLSISAARCDMFLKIFVLERLVRALERDSSLSSGTWRRSSCMPRSSTSARSSNTNIRSWIFCDSRSSTLRVADDRLALLAIHEIQMSAATFEPPSAEVLLECRAGELLLHHVVELGERHRLHAVERGDAHHEVRAHALGQEARALRRPGRGRGTTSTMAMICGCSLRTSSATRSRVHPLERFEALAAAVIRMRSMSARGLVVAERVDQHLAHEIVAAHAHRGLRSRRRC